jgi:RNA-binding protein YlmH
MVFRYVTPKVKLGELHPLPEHVEEMAVEVEKTSVSSFQKSQLEMHTAVDMLSALRLDGAASRNSACTLSREGSFDDVFG